MWWMVEVLLMSLTCDAQVERLYSQIPDGRFVGSLEECEISLDFRKEE